MKTAARSILACLAVFFLFTSCASRCRPVDPRGGETRVSGGDSKAGNGLTGGEVVKVRGVLVAYGNEPHVVWVIRAEDGTLYYPRGDLQKAIALLTVGTYEWEGTAADPVDLPGLIPKHEKSFTTLSWKKLCD